MYKLKTAPTSEPITTDQAKAHLQVTGTDFDDEIDAWIIAARQYVENYTGRQIMPATWELYMDQLPDDHFYIEPCPVTGVSEVLYFDSDNAEQTIDADDLDINIISEPAKIQMAYGESWPTTYEKQNAVKVTFISGYSNNNVPYPIKSAMLLIIGHLFENRGDEGHRNFPKSINNLLDPYVITHFS